MTRTHLLRRSSPNALCRSSFATASIASRCSATCARSPRGTRGASDIERASRWHLRQSLSIAMRYGVDAAAAPQAASAVDHAGVDASPTGPWWTGLTRDVLYARRAIVQRPLLSFTVVVTLALALAANSTTFSLMDALVLRPYRFAGVDRLVVATTVAPDNTSSIESTSPPPIFASGANSRARSRTGRCTSGGTPTCPASTSPSRSPAFFVSPGFFELLGSTPIIGRGFTESEAQPGQHHRVVLGHGLWTRRFASDPNIVGKSVRLDGEPYEVVGVAPPGFTTPDGAELWAPIALDRSAMGGSAGRELRHSTAGWRMARPSSRREPSSRRSSTRSAAIIRTPTCAATRA